MESEYSVSMACFVISKYFIPEDIHDLIKILTKSSVVPLSYPFLTHLIYIPRDKELSFSCLFRKNFLNPAHVCQSAIWPHNMWSAGKEKLTHSLRCRIALLIRRRGTADAIFEISSRFHSRLDVFCLLCGELCTLYVCNPSCYYIIL